MHVKHCKISRYKQLRLMEHFVAGTPARTAAELVGVHRGLRRQIFPQIARRDRPQAAKARRAICGKIELDESYFGGRRKGRRGRGAAGKVIVFGLLKRGGKVYTVTVPDTKRDTLMPVIKEKIAPDSVVYTDGHTAYNTLSASAFHHFRINHSKEFVHNHTHINGIENFWSQAKRHLRKYNGKRAAEF